MHVCKDTFYLEIARNVYFPLKVLKREMFFQCVTYGVNMHVKLNLCHSFGRTLTKISQSIHQNRVLSSLFNVQKKFFFIYITLLVFLILLLSEFVYSIL